MRCIEFTQDRDLASGASQLLSLTRYVEWLEKRNFRLFIARIKA